MSETTKELMRGYVHPHIELFHSLENGDRGVVATQDIKEGTELVVLPTANTLHMPSLGLLQSSPEGAYSEAAAFLANHAHTPSPFLSTSLLLMAEMAKGEASPFAAYIRSLPDDVDCLLAWDGPAKEELRGTSIEDPTKGASTKDMFQKEVEPKIKERQDLWPAPFNSFEAFCRAAALVQSRAFHMEDENAQPDMQREGTDLYMIPAIDMINHASNPARRNSSLCRLNAPKKVKLADGETDFSGFFQMKATRDIRKGEEILHTYGELSDAALLQTYGFIDEQSRQGAAGSGRGAGANTRGAASAAADQSGPGPASSSKEAKEGGAGHDAGGAEMTSQDVWVNPNNHVLVPFQLVQQCTRSMLSEAMEGVQAFDEQLEASKLSFLAEHLLQTAAPLATDFVCTHSQPLSDELLTVVQVMLLTREEFEELRRVHLDDEWVEREIESRAAGASSSKGAEQQQQQQPRKPRKTLLLGTGLIEQDPDFAELVSLTLIQVLDAAMRRYTTTLQEDVELIHSLAAPQPEPLVPQAPEAKAQARQAQRKRLAAMVRAAEKAVLLAGKREAVTLVLSCRRGQQGEGSSDEEEGGLSAILGGSGDEEDDESGDEELLELLLREKAAREGKAGGGGGAPKQKWGDEGGSSQGGAEPSKRAKRG